MMLLVIALLCDILFGSRAIALDLPPLKSTINDSAGMLPPASFDDLEQRLRRFKTETADNVVILTVKSLDGEPVAGAVLDLWQTDGEGLYEDQREVDGPWMRGLYRSQPDGSYVIRTVAPIAYTIPMDGTVGELMERTNISHMRPAHIHFAITAPGYDTCVTHLFQKGDEFIETDVVYGVKEPLIVEFVKKPPGKAPSGETLSTPFYEVRYDFVLQQKAEALAAAE